MPYMRIGERPVLKTGDLNGFQGSSPWYGAMGRGFEAMSQN